MKSKYVKKLVLLALFLAIEFILIISPLGYVNVGPVRATTLHIPVIIASIVLGPKYGMFVGLFFGASSVAINTFSPTPASFLFSPFYQVGQYKGSVFSLIIALVPRIGLGYFSYYTYRFLQKGIKQNDVAIALSACFNTLLHSVLVLGFIYIFYAEGYAALKGVSVSKVVGVIASIIAVNGVLETVVAGVVVLAVCKAMFKLYKED
ncbi:MAG: ECF transporter S component [Erysipelotrichaceae bacterium]|nr:ECF transporter S component [Erysipelotrichaceae bacterium]